MGRDGRPSTCFGKACPGPINTAGTRNFKTFTFTNNAGAPRCFTVTINAALGGAGDIQSAAYQTAYTPPVAMGDPTGNMCLNYLGDSGVSGLGTTLGTASYSFTVPAQTNFVIVVNTVNGSTNSSVFSGTVSGFTNNTAGPGACAGATQRPTATPDGYANRDLNADSYCHGNTNGDCYGHGHSNSYRDSCTHSDSDRYSHGNADSYCDSSTYCDSDCYSHGDSYSYCDSCCDAKPDTDTDSIANGDSNPDTDRPWRFA